MRSSSIRLFGFFVVLGIVAGMPMISNSSQAAPRELLNRYCEADSEGKQFSPEGWKELSSLFVEDGIPKHDRIIVIKDFVVSNPLPKGDGQQFYVEYVYLGQIKVSDLRFSSLGSPFPTSPVKVRAEFEVVPIANSTDLSQSSTAGWRIKGAPPEPHMTVEAAIKYVERLRDQNTNQMARQNATRTLTALRRLR